MLRSQDPWLYTPPTQPPLFDMKALEEDKLFLKNLDENEIEFNG